MQSTGATNIMTVNSVLNGKAYIQKKVKGSEGSYYHCVLEDNPVRSTMYYDPSLGLLPGDKNTQPYIQLGSRRQSTTAFQKRKKTKQLG